MRRAGDLVPGEDPLLIGRAGRCPRTRSPSGSCGRPGTTRPPSTAGPAARRRTQTCSSQRRGVVGVDVVGAVLEAHQVARRGLAGAGGRRPAEAELRPLQHGGPAGRPDHVADGVEDDLRVVGAGLDAQVAVGDAPASAPRRRGWCRTAVSAAGIRSARPNRSSNRLGPKPTVMVSECGPRSIASPVSNGGCSVAHRGVADRFAGGEPGGDRRPAAEHPLQFVDVGRW